MGGCGRALFEKVVWVPGLGSTSLFITPGIYALLNKLEGSVKMVEVVDHTDGVQCLFFASTMTLFQRSTVASAFATSLSKLDFESSPPATSGSWPI